jgi:serine/threonine protein kinase
MSLSPGQSLSFYEVIAPLGAGGMGEVWRARDTRLQRDVALKVLPPRFADDEDRLQRFDREARALAALNHPNVAGIHGIDRVDGVCFLALELVPGEDLAERIARGPLPRPEALDVCRQIAEGLEAAHEAGVLHRDLKPANVRVTADGVVKLLDFGLAKSAGPGASGAGTSMAGGPGAEPDSFLTTEEGLVLGTPTYMSPEQARGRAVDRRTDIWALGCVLFECLCGRRAFGGDSVTDVLAAVIEREPDWSALPGDTPPRIRELLGRCLDKDSRTRLRDAGEARVLLGRPESADGTPVASDASPASSRSSSSRLPWVVAAIALAAAALAWGRELIWSAAPPSAATETRFVLDESVLSPGYWGGELLAISPDGRFVATVGVPGDSRVHLRDLTTFAAVPVEGSEDARTPFFSPDGARLGFWSRGVLRSTPTAGGPLTEIARMGAVNGADWITDEVIVASGRVTPLMTIDVASGDVAPLTETAPTAFHENPERLTGGAGVLFDEGTRVHHVRMSDGVVTPLDLEGEAARWSSTGHLIASRKDGSLWATPFDPERLAITGPSFAVVAEPVLAFDVAADGTLVYLPGHFRPRVALVHVDRQGGSRSLGLAADHMFAPRVSPDGGLVAAAIAETSGSRTDIWVMDPARGARTRLTTSETFSSWPVWIHDGAEIAFLSEGTLHALHHDGGDDQPRPLLNRPANFDVPVSWSDAADALAFYDYGEASDLQVLHADGTVQTFLATPYDERASVISPDGQWIAYVSDRSGADEVYVRSFRKGESAGPRVALSVDGGIEPRWSFDGKELTYRRGSQMFAVAFEGGSPPVAGAPELLFDRPFALSPVGRGNPNYDTTRDGSFLMLEAEAPQDLQRVHVVRNWIVR